MLHKSIGSLESSRKKIQKSLKKARKVPKENNRKIKQWAQKPKRKFVRRSSTFKKGIKGLPHHRKQSVHVLYVEILNILLMLVQTDKGATTKKE